MRRVIPGVLTAIASVWIAVTCSQGNQAINRKFDACVARGVAYFRDAGLPILSDGKTPKQGAEQRCARSVDAFGPVS